jgi:[ribosomal protein S5]-alanine N-acetyltransferase
MLIKTKDLVLRHVKSSDAKVLFEIELDKDNIKNMMSHAKNLAEVKRSVKNKIKDYKKSKPHEELIIIETKEGAAGYVSIHDLNNKYAAHKAFISYALHPHFRGKGITTKAVKLVTKYAFKKYKLKRIEAHCRTFNKASARVLEKSGFKLEGILHKNQCKNGKYLDDMIWAKVK